MKLEQTCRDIFLGELFLSLALAATAAVPFLVSFPTRAATQSSEIRDTSTAPIDIVVVLDNSGSMKQNDPQSLMRDTVLAFAERLEGDARLALVLFDQGARVPLRLTEVRSAAFAQDVREALAQVDYRGQWTDIPAGLERALYELKRDGRAEAQPLVVLLTDGLVDVGDPAKDLARARWLRDELVSQAKRLGVRIFGIAFTEAADFQLMQSLAESTGGDYFRVLTALDIPDAFQQINARLELLARESLAASGDAAEVLEPTASQETEGTPGQVGTSAEQAPSAEVPAKPAPSSVSEPHTAPSPPPEHPSFSRTGWWALLVGIGGLGVVLVFLYTRRRTPGTRVKMPQATLYDLGGHTAASKYSLKNPLTRIGREPSANDIVIPQDTVSTEHAVIEFRDGAFYLRDLRSSNGTFVNDRKFSDPEAEREVLLKHDDRIRFDEYGFRFVLEDLAGAKKTRIGGARKRGTVVRAKQAAAEPGAPAAANLEATGEGGEDDESPGTILKSMCPNHPAWAATELCPACGGAYCKHCMQEKAGQRVCITCAQQAA